MPFGVGWDLLQTVGVGIMAVCCAPSATRAIGGARFVEPETAERVARTSAALAALCVGGKHGFAGLRFARLSAGRLFV